MPSTQAYSVDWTVTIQPEGDVSADVAEITIIREDDVNSATVTLDTSERPHALEEQKDITITITDGNDTVEFTGFTDSVKDDAERPVVKVDARNSEGKLDDQTAVGFIDAQNLFEVVDVLVDEEPGLVQGITFDKAGTIDQYGTLANSVDFGSISIAHYPRFGVDEDTFIQGETAANEKEAELRISSYQNDTSEFYTLTIEGKDADGAVTTAKVDLPPGDSVQDAFGTDSFPLAFSGGNGLVTEITDISTDIPTLTQGSDPTFGVGMSADIFNYVKTNWEFSISGENSVREALRSIVGYISALDNGDDWEFTVDANDNLVLRPEAEAPSPTTHVFREGSNVIRPVAKRDVDGVRNFIKLEGADPRISRWAWAYNGNFYIDPNNPFYDDPSTSSIDEEDYPEDAVVFDQSPAGGQNDIDEIGLRGVSLQSDSITSHIQAINLAQKALNEYYRTPVSGKAPVEGVKDVKVGDQAEVYYPSRGIPAKVASNVFSVKKVEYRVTPEDAKTVVEFGTKDPNLADMIASGGNPGRSDISESIRNLAGDGPGGRGSGGFTPVKGTITSVNDDGTVDIEAANGEVYENVELVSV